MGTNGITDPDELNEIEYRLFQQATGKGEIGHASGTDDDKESNIIDLFEELGVPEGRSKPTLLNEYEAEVQEGPFLQRPNDRDNDETFQFEENKEGSGRRPNNTNLLQHYLRLKALRGTNYRLSDILCDLRENQENIEQIGFGISIVRKYIQMLIEMNEVYQTTAAIPPGLLQEIERRERDLHHEMGDVIQQIRNYNVCDNETEAVCQSLQLASRMYNDQKLLITKHFHNERPTVSHHGIVHQGPDAPQTCTARNMRNVLGPINSEDYDLSDDPWDKLRSQIEDGGRDDQPGTSEEDESNRESLAYKGKHKTELDRWEQNKIRVGDKGNKQFYDGQRTTRPFDNKRMQVPSTKRDQDRAGAWQRATNDMHHGRRDPSPKPTLRPSRRADGFHPGGMLTE